MTPVPVKIYQPLKENPVKQIILLISPQWKNKIQWEVWVNEKASPIEVARFLKQEAEVEPTIIILKRFKN